MRRVVKGGNYAIKNVTGVKSACASAVLLAVLAVPVFAVSAETRDSPVPVVSASTAPSDTPSAESSPATDASAAPVADDSSASTRAKEWLARLEKGQLDRAQLTSALSAGLQSGTVEALSKQLSAYGTPQRIVLRTRQQLAGTTTWTFRVNWPYEVLDYTFGVENATGKISALYLRPDSPA